MSNSWWVFALLHGAFMLTALVGLIAAIIWLNKHAKKDQVKKVMKWALIVGVIGSVLTLPFVFGGMHMDGFGDDYRQGGGHNRMMDDDDDHDEMHKRLEIKGGDKSAPQSNNSSARVSMSIMPRN